MFMPEVSYRSCLIGPSSKIDPTQARGELARVKRPKREGLRHVIIVHTLADRRRSCEIV